MAADRDCIRMNVYVDDSMEDPYAGKECDIELFSTTRSSTVDAVYSAVRATLKQADPVAPKDPPAFKLQLQRGHAEEFWAPMDPSHNLYETGIKPNRTKVYEMRVKRNDDDDDDKEEGA